MRSALVLGASGLVGGELTRVLADAPEYGRVTALVRRPVDIRHPKVTQEVVDFEKLEHWRPLFAVDDLFCCLGTTMARAGSREGFRLVDYEYPLAAARLAAQVGARQYLIITSMGANRYSAFFYNRVKGEVEEDLAEIGFPSLQILRPSLLLGARPERRPGEQLASAVAPALAPLMVGRLRRYRPISGRAVARAMYRIALSTEPGVHIYESDQLAELAAR